MSNQYLEVVSHDAFRYGGGLNKSAGEVYFKLLQGPMSAKELAACTGRNLRTVFRALDHMSRLVDAITGELVSMVYSDDGIWRALEVDLDHVAQIVGTSGKAKKQQEQYLRESKLHSQLFRTGRGK
jgi:hypothetical protein